MVHKPEKHRENTLTNQYVDPHKDIKTERPSVLSPNKAGDGAALERREESLTSPVQAGQEDVPRFEIGDTVRITGSTEVRKIVGTGPGEFFTTQIGNDAGSRKPTKGSDLELVAKLAKPDMGMRFVPTRSIME